MVLQKLWTRHLLQLEHKIDKLVGTLKLHENMKANPASSTPRNKLVQFPRSSIGQKGIFMVSNRSLLNCCGRFVSVVMLVMHELVGIHRCQCE